MCSFATLSLFGLKVPRMVKKTAAFLCVSVIALGAVLRVAGGKATADVPAAAPPPVPVSVATVQQGDVPIELSGLGQVQALNQATIRPQVSGQIAGISYKQGQLVQQGAALVQIDPRSYQAQLAQAEAALAKDKAHLANAEANFRRYATLKDSGFASVQQFQTQQSMVAQAQADVAADNAVIDQDQISLGYTSITAPFTGVTGLRLVDIGNIVQAGQAQALVTIAQIQPIAVLFTLPQSDLPEIQAVMNEAGASHLKVTAWSQDSGKPLGTGRLTAMANAVDTANGTITLRAEFPNAQRLLWPGEFVTARLLVQTVHDGLTIPNPVVQLGPNGSYAWQVNNGKAEIQPIGVTPLADGQDLVTHGLAAGDTVVSDGQYGLSEGAKILIAGGTTASPLRNAQTSMLGIQP